MKNSNLIFLFLGIPLFAIGAFGTVEDKLPTLLWNFILLAGTVSLGNFVIRLIRSKKV